MPPGVRVQLTYEERRALEQMAERNLRRPSEELRRLFLDELRKRHGSDPPSVESTKAPVSVSQADAGALVVES